MSYRTHITSIFFALSLLLIVGINFSVNAQTPILTEQQFSSLQDGDLIRAQQNIDVYIIKIINGKYFKRLVLNPDIFNSYGHLRWENIKQVTQSVAQRFATSNLVREVYPNGIPVNDNVYALVADQDRGTKHLVVGGTYDPDSVYSINHLEASDAFYATGAPVVLEIQTPTYTNRYLLVHAIQNTAHKRSECSSDLLGLERAIGDKLLIPDDVCVQYLSSPASAQNETLLGAYRFNSTRGLVEVYTNRATTAQEKQHTLLHELCHANQHYHLQTNNTYNWNNTPAGREFIAITRYSYNENQLPQYTLPENSIFLGKYGEYQPIELAADICAMLLIPELSTHRYSQGAINTITGNAQILNWFNTYVLYSPNSPQPIAPFVIHPLTQQEKHDIYNDINLIVNMLVNGTNDAQETLENALYIFMSYNEQARRYALTLIPNLLDAYTTPVSTNITDLQQRILTLQNRLNELGNTINALKAQINALIAQGNADSETNNLISQHNAFVDEHNRILADLQTEIAHLQSVQRIETKNRRAKLVTELFTEWLGELIETGEV